MKKILLLLFMVNIMLAIEQVPRQRIAGDDKKLETKSEVKQNDSRNSTRDARSETRTTVQNGEKQPDRFQDTNSNGVNDRREDDFQSIKTKKSKYKELFGKKDDQAEKKQRENPPREEKESDRKKEK